MKRLSLIATAVVSAASSAGAFAHPGIHHLTGAGHSLGMSDAATFAFVGVWLLAQTAFIAGWLIKRCNARR
jgi:hypothetical protein